MMSLHLKRLLCCGAVAFLAMSLGVGNAAGQNGVCVMNTQIIPFHCQSGCSPSGCACTSQTNLLEPSGGGYGQGQLYQTAKTQCCGNDLSYIQNPSGVCFIGGQTPGGARAALALGTRRVFVRGCGGRFRLVSVAV